MQFPPGLYMIFQHRGFTFWVVFNCVALWIQFTYFMCKWSTSRFIQTIANSPAVHHSVLSASSSSGDLKGFRCSTCELPPHMTPHSHAQTNTHKKHQTNIRHRHFSTHTRTGWRSPSVFIPCQKKRPNGQNSFGKLCHASARAEWTYAYSTHVYRRCRCVGVLRGRARARALWQNACARVPSEPARPPSSHHPPTDPLRPHKTHRAQARPAVGVAHISWQSLVVRDASGRRTSRRLFAPARVGSVADRVCVIERERFTTRDWIAGAVASVAMMILTRQHTRELVLAIYKQWFAMGLGKRVCQC